MNEIVVIISYLFKIVDTNESPEQKCLSVKFGENNRDSDISNRSQSEDFTSSEIVSKEKISKRDIDLHLKLYFKKQYDVSELLGTFWKNNETLFRFVFCILNSFYLCKSWK